MLEITTFKYGSIFFFLPGFYFTTIHELQTAGEGGGHFFNSSVSLAPASQTFRH